LCVSCVVVQQASRSARLVDGGKIMRARGAGSCVRVLGDGIEKCGNDIEEGVQRMNDQRGRLSRCGGGLALFVSGCLF
jgi:hypothetical protein